MKRPNQGKVQLTLEHPHWNSNRFKNWATLEPSGKAKRSLSVLTGGLACAWIKETLGIYNGIVFTGHISHVDFCLWLPENLNECSFADGIIIAFLLELTCDVSIELWLCFVDLHFQKKCDDGGTEDSVIGNCSWKPKGRTSKGRKSDFEPFKLSKSLSRSFLSQKNQSFKRKSDQQSLECTTHVDALVLLWLRDFPPKF